MQKYTRRTVFLGLAATLPACALPRGAPRRSEIIGDGESTEFAVYDIDGETLETIKGWPAIDHDDGAGWIPGGQAGADPRISPGDRLDMQIWDSDEPSLITGPEDRMSEMENIQVDTDGRVFVPFIGKIEIAGMSVPQARAAIQERLEDISPSAQLQMQAASGRRNSVDVVSGVSAPGRYPLEDGQTTILNLIAESGGVAEMRNPRVRLTRGGQSHLAPLDRLQREPGQDTVLRGGDKITIEEDTRHFIALGASGREEVVDFDAESISAIKAVSMMGGVEDRRGDPKGILILRRYSPEDVGAAGPSHHRVVFTINMTDADGLFSASEFEVAPGDLVLATESPTSSASTILGLLGDSLRVGSRARDI